MNSAVQTEISYTIQPFHSGKRATGRVCNLPLDQDGKNPDPCRSFPGKLLRACQHSQLRLLWLVVRLARLHLFHTPITILCMKHLERNRFNRSIINS